MSGNEDGKHKREILDLPETVDATAVNAAEIAVVKLAAERRIGVREALCFSRMLEHRRRAISTTSLEQMMRRIEAENREKYGEKR